MGNISLGSFRRAVEDVRINGMVMINSLLHTLHIVSIYSSNSNDVQFKFFLQDIQFQQGG